MRVNKYKVICYSFLLGGVLSLSLAPAFAVSHGGKEEGGMEKQKMHQSWFQKLDEDGDGKISKDEYQEHMEKHFKEMDKDGDDSVTQEEWKEGHAKKHHRRGHEGSQGQGHSYGGGQGQGQEGM